MFAGIASAGGQDGSFAERWLLLLNCYPLAEDLAEVEDTLQLLLKHPELAGFNGIFWSGPPDWKLSRVPLVSTLSSTASSV